MFGIIPVSRRFTTSVGVDMGTGNTLVHVRGEGIVLNEPSVVAVDTVDRTVKAVGLDAKQMIGRTPGRLEAIRPLRDGAIADVTLAEEMLRRFLRRAIHRWHRAAWVHVVVAVPTGLTVLERRAIEASALAAGARAVHTVPEPIAAAIGIGLDVDTAEGHVVVDIGGGSTQIAVMALGGILSGASVRVGGDRLDRAIAAHIRRNYGLVIGEASAEQVKIRLGAAELGPEARTTTVSGRDLVSGLPKTIVVDAADVQEAIREPIQQMVDAVIQALEKAPPELAGDIVDRGITLAGGGALLTGLDRLIARAAGVPVRVAADPMTCVVRGTARIVEDFERYRGLQIA
ncbi:MAG TPA: rod shape-determining protein [Longimicrobiales bacterium]